MTMLLTYRTMVSDELRRRIRAGQQRRGLATVTEVRTFVANAIMLAQLHLPPDPGAPGAGTSGRTGAAGASRAIPAGRRGTQKSGGA